MGSIPDPPGGYAATSYSPSSTHASFDDFQRQTSLMTSCTLLWKELSDHFTSLERDIMDKSEALKRKIQTLDEDTKKSLEHLKKRELTIEESIEISIKKLEENQKASLSYIEKSDDGGEVDDSEGLLLSLKKFCYKMDATGFWKFVATRKKEIEAMRENLPLALMECVDPLKFVLEAISEVFPEDKKADDASKGCSHYDLGWACVLVLESLIPAVADPALGRSRMLVTPAVKERAKEVAKMWKDGLEGRGGIEIVKTTPDVHTFLQFVVSFGIVDREDLQLYRKLVVGSAWRKQMPKLAVSLGLGDQMAGIIEELISRGQQLDAVHFAYEVNLVDKYPAATLLKSYLKDAKKAANSMLDDHSNSGRSAQLSGRKEQSALRAVIKCIEEYKLEGDFPPENLKKRVEQLEKAKTDKKRPAAVAPATKRTRASNVGPMPPAKAGRLSNAYVSSAFPTAPTFVRSPSHSPYSPLSPYPYDRSPGPAMYGNRSPQTSPYAYSPEAAHPSPGPYHPYSPEAARPSPGPYHPYSPEVAHPSPGQYHPYSPEAAHPSPGPYHPYSPEAAHPSPGPYHPYSPEAAPPPAGPYHSGYSPEAAPHPGSYHAAPQMTYPAYGGYGNGLAPVYQQAYY